MSDRGGRTVKYQNKSIYLGYYGTQPLSHIMRNGEKFYLREWVWADVDPEKHAEYLSAGIGASVELIPTVYSNYYNGDEQLFASLSATVEAGYALTDNFFLEVHNEVLGEDWGKVIVFQTDHKLYNASTGDFQLVDAFASTYAPLTFEDLGNHTYKLTFFDFNNADDSATLKFLGVYATNAVGVLYAPFELAFIPQNLVPTFIPLPEVEAIWNE